MNFTIPHQTWDGRFTTLKGVAHDPDGDATLATYSWDFGDGTSSGVLPASNPYNLSVTHAYSGAIGTTIVARLTVTDVTGLTGSDTYLLRLADPADLQVHVDAAIDEGLWILHVGMNRFMVGAVPAGTWDFGGYWNAATGAATEAFEVQGSLPTGDPTKDPYVEDVQRGLVALLNGLRVAPVGPEPTHPGDNPDANGNGIGLWGATYDWEQTYEDGIVLMAIASSRSPNWVAPVGDATWVQGRKLVDIAQDMVDLLAWAQNDPTTGTSRGGWRYLWNYGNSDNSVSQWPVIGMESAEVNFGGAGLVIPAYVKSELDFWVTFIQAPDGGSGYDSPADGTENVAKTGGLLAEMKFLGDRILPAVPPRVQSALDYLGAHWVDGGQWWPGNLGDYYAMYSVMKGLRLLGVALLPNATGGLPIDWYADYARWLTSASETGNYTWWGGGAAGVGYPLSHAWAILTLSKTVVQPGPVAVAGPDVNNQAPTVPVTFDGSHSYHADPTRHILRYEWDFGDGSVRTLGAVVTHAFPAVLNPDGTINWPATVRDYTVTLIVGDDSTPELTSTDTLVVHITAPPFPPVADVGGPYTALQGVELVLDGSHSYDPSGVLYPDPADVLHHGYLTQYEWDVDGTGFGAPVPAPAGAHQPVTFSTLGLHVVRLRVTNSFGMQATAGTLVNVVPNIVVDVLQVTPTSVTLHWTTALLADAKVQYGFTTAYTGTVLDPVATTNHTVTLTGLAPGKLHHFMVTSSAPGVTFQSPDQVFITAPSLGSVTTGVALVRVAGTLNVYVTLNNNGAADLTNVWVTRASLRAALNLPTTTPMPLAVGVVPAHGTSTFALAFPGNVGATGSVGLLSLNWAHAGGNASASLRVTLP
jgi:hypothetical protein